MLHRIPQRDPIAAQQRRTIAMRRVGKKARCACGEKRPEALMTNPKPVTCAACKRQKKGQMSDDNHHPAGKNNSPITIPVPINDHRAILSVEQQDWPRETLENRDRSPLLIAAACIRGFVDTALYLIESLLHWIADLLEELNILLIQRLGSKWWLNTKVSKTLPTGWSR
jgi:hypothetical protein